MVECSICFNELFKLKVLSCGHCYCEACIAELVSKKSVQAADIGEKSALATTTGSSGSGEVETITLTCPECRQMIILEATGLKGLKSKFIGQFPCFNCAETKDTSELRWCMSCDALVCADCFASRHFQKQEDGSTTLHRSTNWDEHGAVQFCIAQLKLKYSKLHQAVENTETYMNSYLDGFREYLSHELRQKSAPSIKELQSMIDLLSQEFQIDAKELKNASEVNRSYETILSGLGKLLRTEDAFRMSGDTKTHFHSIPYTLLAKYLLTSEKEQFFPQWFDAAKFRRKSQESLLIGSNLIKNPSDICNLTTDVLLVTDSDVGIFMFKNRCLLQGPVPLKFKHVAQFGKLCKVADVEGKPTALLNTRGPNASWAYMLLQLESTGDLQFVSRKGCSHWPLPSNENLTIMASARCAYALSSKSLFRFLGIDGDPMWKCVYTPSSTNPHHLRLGSVIDKPHTTEVVIMNISWQCFDIICIGHDDAVWGVRRIEFPLPLERPFLVACSGDHTSGFLLGDKTGSAAHLWHDKNPAECTRLAQWKHKTPLKIIVQPSAVFIVMQLRDRSNQRCLEMIQM
uniref:RING-type domain-containing protein n=1 Tax=Plectus sambesii TaxID=2011161 RepID=A0A914W826_9BILA